MLAVPRDPMVIGHRLRVEGHPSIRWVVSCIPVHVHLVRSQVGKQMWVVLDSRLAWSRNTRSVQVGAPRHAAALASMQNRMKVNIHTCA